MSDHDEIPSGSLTSYDNAPLPAVGDRVVLVGQGGEREIGVVVCPANPQLTVGGIWVHSPSKGFASHYAYHNVFQLKKSRIDELIEERDRLAAEVARLTEVTENATSILCGEDLTVGNSPLELMAKKARRIQGQREAAIKAEALEEMALVFAPESSARADCLRMRGAYLNLTKEES